MLIALSRLPKEPSTKGSTVCTISATERGTLLFKLADLMEQHKDELATIRNCLREHLQQNQRRRALWRLQAVRIRQGSRLGGSTPITQNEYCRYRVLIVI